MKKAIGISIIALSVLNGASIEDALSAGKVSGELRAAYVGQNNAVNTDTYGTSLGGQLKYETGSWNDLKVGAALYISQKIPFATGDASERKANNDLFANNAASYGYLGEAYIDYSANDFSLRIGRQQIDTPLADTDDVRMHPNTFEALMATYTGFEKNTLVGGYVKRFAGYDSGNDISKFKRLDGVDSRGAALFGVVNESIENLALQGWYYKIDNIANAIYADGVYTMAIDETLQMELSTQLGHFGEEQNSNVEGNVFGIGAKATLGMLSVGVAYNKTNNSNGKKVINGFGGGPYFTSMEEMTIDSMEDARAYQLNAQIDMSEMGIEGLTLSTMYGSFKSTPMNWSVKESDFIIAYQINDALSAQMSYALINDNNKNTLNNGSSDYDGGYDRLFLRLSYNF